MFSPFHDENGHPKSLVDVTWSDLDQLRDMDEGFVLEFKQAYTPSVRRKIPKIVASFSNSRGGWLIIGISDKDKAVCPIPRGTADFGQRIGESCRHHISPTPHFDVRFLPDPANDQQGVVLVQVFEGDFPPYVANGVVEVREGSTSGPANGAALVDLYGKATKRRVAISEFCRRSVYYPDVTPGDQPTALFDLYFFRLGRRVDRTATRKEDAEHVSAMRESFSRQGMDCRVQHAHDSLIFRTTSDAGSAEAGSAIELFGDESMKLSVPAMLLSGMRRSDAIARLRLLGADVAGNAQLIDASATLRSVSRMASLLDRYVRTRGLAWQNYAVAYELEGMAGVLLWSEDPVYLEYVRDHGLLFCGTTDCRSRVRYLDDGIHGSFRARQFAGSHFFEACGLPLGSKDPEDLALVDALLSTSH